MTALPAAAAVHRNIGRPAARRGREPTPAVVTAGVPGTVYLLHFDELYVPYPGAPPLCCAGHYTGFAPGGPRGLRRRLAKHGTKEGARLMLVIAQAGISWQLARTWWPGTRDLERRLKVQGGASRRCPLCGVVPRPGPLPRNVDGRVSRSLTSDMQKDAAGLMTAAQLSEHTALRRGAVSGKLPRPLDRGPVAPEDDPWASPLPAFAGAAHSGADLTLMRGPEAVPAGLAYAEPGTAAALGQMRDRQVRAT